MFMMPLHPLDRVTSQTLREDREAIILADKLGFLEALVESIDVILAICEG
jgi:hypothetical protein